MSPKARPIRAKDLVVVASAESFRRDNEPPHRIGDIVRLNSGGPTSLVVDVDGGVLTVAWRDSDGCAKELAGPDVCFHRAREIW